MIVIIAVWAWQLVQEVVVVVDVDVISPLWWWVPLNSNDDNSVREAVVVVADTPSLLVWFDFDDDWLW